MTFTINVPNTVSRIRFLDDIREQSPKETTVVFRGDVVEGFKKGVWYGSRNGGPVSEGRLEPTQGTVINATAYVDYDTRRLPTDETQLCWHRGNVLGGLYTLKSVDLERIESRNHAVGWIRPARGGLMVPTHHVDKSKLVREGDRALCTEHVDDGLFEFQLLHNDVGILVPVEEMNFRAYLLTPAQETLRVEFTPVGWK